MQRYCVDVKVRRFDLEEEIKQTATKASAFSSLKKTIT